MEITSIDIAKKEIGNKVRCILSSDMPVNLAKLEAPEGTLIKIIHTVEYTKDGTKDSFEFSVDITDPDDGGIHHRKAKRIFSIDEKEIKSIVANEKIAELKEQIATLEAGKV